jgi:hypothetical protein
MHDGKENGRGAVGTLLPKLAQLLSGLELKSEQ